MIRRAVTLLVALLAPAALLAGLPAAPAGAQATATPVDAPPVISRSLADVEVDGIAYRVIAEELDLVRSARRRAEADLVRLAAEERSLAAAVARAGALERLARHEAQAWGDRLEVLAVEAYLGAGVDADAQAAGLDPGYTQGEERSLLTSEVDHRWRGEWAEARAVADRARRDQGRLRGEHVEVVADQERTEARRAEAAAEQRRLAPEVAAARATATVLGSDLTLVALDAYLRAALEVNADEPGCRVPWWLLAGIGRVESGHGTFATSTLDEAGTARPSIIGIALDGGRGTAVITDTDAGVLDGDTVSDRAVGPMQFIPSTWARYAADGNGDRIADPQNLYDAAHAAARYLCVAASPLDDPTARTRAVHAYNHSDAYVATVLGFADEYARFSPA